MLLRTKIKSPKLNYLYYVAIILSTLVNTLAMETMPEENPHPTSSPLNDILTDDCISAVLQKLPTSTAIFNLTSTCKRFHNLELENLGYLESIIFINGLKDQIVKETENNKIKLIQIKQTLIFQNNIFSLVKALDVDINQKQRGQITITSRLSAKEIYEILWKTPRKYIDKLPCNVQWIHWISYAPLFAETQAPCEDKIVENLSFFKKNNMNNLRYSDVVHYSQSIWEIGLNERIYGDPKAGFLWALLHQVNTISPHKFVVEFITTHSKPPKIKAFDYHNYTSDDTLQRHVWRCYDRAINAKIPTAQEEYDEIKGQRNI